MIDLSKTTSEVTEERTKIGEALAFVEAYVISSEDDYTFAGALLRDAKTSWKRLEERRTQITAPLLEAKRSVDALFKPALDGLLKVEKRLKEKVGEYTALKEAERVAAMHKSAAEYAAGGTPTDIIPNRPEAKGVSVRAVWDFEITDAAAVPREFCSPDPDKIKACRDWSAYSEQFPPPPVPGVRFYLRQAVRVMT